MSMNFPLKFIHYVIGTITLCEGGIIELEERKKIDTKYICETIDVIPLFALVGVILVNL